MEARSRTPRNRALQVGTVLLLLWCGGCSLIVDPDVESLGPEPLTCEEFDCNLCACQPDNVASYQLCTAEGEFGPCLCDPPRQTLPPTCIAPPQGE